MRDPVKVLDHGFVQILDTMGDDYTILESARVSTGGSASKGDAQDRSLMHRLMRCYHTSPFEMCEVRMKVKLPIFVARQWVRHRTSSLNEVSARYTELPEEFYIPEDADVREQSKMDRQGRDEQHHVLRDLVASFRRDCYRTGTDAFMTYHHHLDQKLSREIVRINLPLSTYTTWIWKIDLHNLLHFLRLRMDSHAQYEIRQYANVIAEFVQGWVPMAWEAFCEHRLGAVTLSKTAADLVRQYALENPGFAEFLSKATISKSEFRDGLGRLLVSQ